MERGKGDKGWHSDRKKKEMGKLEGGRERSPVNQQVIPGQT